MYQAEVQSYQQFCNQFNIQQFHAASLSYTALFLYPPSYSMYPTYRTIKICLAGIHLEHLERGLYDLTDNTLLQLLCTRIKCSQGTTTSTHLPITIDQLHSLKTQLINDASYSLIEKGCCGQHLHWPFVAFSGPVSLCHQACSSWIFISQLLPVP